MKTLQHLTLVPLAVLLLQPIPAAFSQESNQDSMPVTDAIASEIAAETNGTGSEILKPPTARRHGPVIAIGQAAKSRPGHSAEAVIAIGGSAEAHSEVSDAVVGILGDAYSKERVGEAVVAILGDVHVEGEVGGAAVAILGNVALGSNAVVREAIAIGGTVTMADGAEVHGTIQEIPIHIPGLSNIRELPLWVRDCVLKLRLLSLNVAWPWAVAGVFVLIYALVALAFPRPVAASLDEISRRPATAFFVGLLTKTLLPVLSLILLATGIGIVVLPFLFAACLFTAIVGKVAMIQYLGGAITRATGIGGTLRNLLSLCVGSAILLLLYSIPIVGFLAYTLFGIWALGAAVTAAFNHNTRSTPRTATPSTPPPSSHVTGESAAGSGEIPNATAPSPTNAAAGIPPAAIHPRAGFWERMGAAFLDMALLSIPFVIIGPFAIPVAIAYFAGMWTWKGTTIGGIVLRHQIVRQNGEPVTFLVALVRSLGAVFSAFVLFLGFFWIGWSREKQGWHDLLAGTYVVRLPQAIPLVCL